MSPRLPPVRLSDYSPSATMTTVGRSGRGSGSSAWRFVGAFLPFLALVLLARAPDLFYHYRDWDEAAMMAQA
jgi:hypothetical protein